METVGPGILLVLVTGFLLGLQPNVVVKPQTNLQCVLVEIRRFYNTTVMYDRLVCGERRFIWNGDDILKKEV
jgi:hypothetical protein